MTVAEACKKLHLDAVSISNYALQKREGYEPTFIEKDTYVDEWGRIIRVMDEIRTNWWIGGTIETPEDLDEWEPPDPNDPGRGEVLETLINNFGEEMAIITPLQTGFVIAWEIRGGIDKLIKDIYVNPCFARRLLKKVADSTFEWGKMMMDAGPDILVLSDDYADSHGPFLNPETFRNFELPYLKRMCKEARKRGIPVLKHSDGNLLPILEDLVNSGINDLHPIEPGVMDIGVVKEKMGKNCS